MATSANAGAIGWGPQPNRVTPASTFFYHKAREANLTPTELIRDFDPEIGSSLLNAGRYKAAYWAGGTVDIVPRLNATLGWLLYAFAGHASSNGAVGTGYMHQFPAQPDNAAPQQWLTLRRILPGFNEDTGAREFMGEVYEQCKVTGITLGASPASVLEMQIQMLGLNLGVPVDNPDWTDNYAFEDFTGVPIATKGAFMMKDGTEIDTVTNCQLSMALDVNPREDLVVGKYTPHDISMPTRTIQVTGTFFWRNPTLYKKLYYTDDLQAWKPETYDGDGEFHMYFETPANLSGRSYPAKIGFKGKRVTWTAEPLGLRGGQNIAMRLTGTITDAVTGIDWQMYLVNDHAAYDWGSPS